MLLASQSASVASAVRGERTDMTLRLVAGLGLWAGLALGLPNGAVMEGYDVVAYYSLQEGDSGVPGSAEFVVQVCVGKGGGGLAAGWQRWLGRRR